MSRLFEALSGLKTEHRATQVLAPPEIAPPAVVPPKPKQEAKPEQPSLKVVPPTLGPLPVDLPEPVHQGEEVNQAVPEPAENVEPPAILVSASSESLLVALTDPNSL